MWRSAIICFVVLSCTTGISAQESLRKYADSLGLNLGVAFRESYISGTGSTATTHNNIVKTEFNTLVCENAMKAQSLTSSKNSYNFSTADKIVDFAIRNNMKIRGHTLVWYNQNARWLTTGTRDTLLANMKNHIEKVMSHYKGKLFQWDVVNEPFGDTGGYRIENNPWQTIIGEDYIDSAFVYAHAADPDCKLYINDFYTTFASQKADFLYDKVKLMLENGIPIHGVGFQCHEVTVDPASGYFEAVKNNFERFAALGLDLAVTEFDIQGSDMEMQGDDYAALLKVALAIPHCRTFMIWGVSDKDSWTRQPALVYDSSFQPKPAYDALLAVLKNPSSIAPVNREMHLPTQTGYLIYNRTTNTISFNDASSNRPTVLELFDLRGARMAKATLPATTPLSLSSMKTAPGTTLIRANNEAVRVNRARR